jgi:hypothetical protein
MRLYLKFLFFLIIVAHTALIGFYVVIPVRTILLIGFFGLAFLAYKSVIVQIIRRHHIVTITFFVMLFLGGVLALLDHRAFGDIGEGFVRNGLQPFLVFVVTYTAIELFGLAFVLNCVIWSGILSGLFALLQSIDFPLSWEVRRLIGQIQGDPADIKEILRTQGRPLGLNFTPILLSYHLVASYALANLSYRLGLMSGRTYAVIAVITLLASAASGTRSLLLGVLLHETLQLALRGKIKSILLLGVMGAGVVGGYYYLTQQGSRIVSVDDASAVSRLTLFQFGLRLLMENPFGYGLGMNTADHAWKFFQEFSHLPKASAIFRISIHNAFINFLLQYGLLGGVYMIACAIFNLKLTWFVMVTFFPYCINAFFHNAGVFVGELYFWFAFAPVLYIYTFLRPRAAAR